MRFRNGKLEVVTDTLGPAGVPRPGRVNGTIFVMPTPRHLGISETYTSEWVDTEDYLTLHVLFATDQVSIPNGIELQWSDDKVVGTVRASEFRTFRAAFITNGRFFRTVTQSRYLRIKYTNSTTAQTRFFIGIRVATDSSDPSIRIEPLAQFQTSQQTVTLTATALTTTALSGRRAIRLKNSVGSSRNIWFGNVSTVSPTTGDEIAPGEAVEFDLDEFSTVYVVTDSLSGSGTRLSYSEFA